MEESITYDPKPTTSPSVVEPTTTLAPVIPGSPMTVPPMTPSSTNAPSPNADDTMVQSYIATGLRIQLSPVTQLLPASSGIAVWTELTQMHIRNHTKLASLPTTVVLKIQNTQQRLIYLNHNDDQRHRQQRRQTRRRNLQQASTTTRALELTFDIALWLNTPNDNNENANDEDLIRINDDEFISFPDLLKGAFDTEQDRTSYLVTLFTQDQGEFGDKRLTMVRLLFPTDDNENNHNNDDSTSSSSDGGISTGMIAGIVGGSVGGLALVGAVYLYWNRRQKDDKNPKDSTFQNTIFHEETYHQDDDYHHEKMKQQLQPMMEEPKSNSKVTTTTSNSNSNSNNISNNQNHSNGNNKSNSKKNQGSGWFGLAWMNSSPQSNSSRNKKKPKKDKRDSSDEDDMGFSNPYSQSQQQRWQSEIVIPHDQSMDDVSTLEGNTVFDNMTRVTGVRDDPTTSVNPENYYNMLHHLGGQQQQQDHHPFPPPTAASKSSSQPIPVDDGMIGGDHPYQPFTVHAPAGTLGMVIETNGGVPSVRAMRDDSPLYGSVQIGDLILSVNGQDVTSYSAMEVSNLIARKQQYGRQLVFCRKAPTNNNNSYWRSSSPSPI
jgi:hypothetical protein